MFDLELEGTVEVGNWGEREDVLILVVFPQAAIRKDTFTKCLGTHDPFSLTYLHFVSSFVLFFLFRFLFCFCLFVFL